MVRVIDILIESEAWLSRTGGIGGLSGSDIVLSGPTEGEDWDEQYQQMATYSHSCTRQQDQSTDTTIVLLNAQLLVRRTNFLLFAQWPPL